MLTQLRLLQAKAAMPDKARETLDLLLKHGKTPDSYSLSTLVDAYARANQPLKAQQCFDTMIAEYGLTPTIANWNALLGAYAKAGHKVSPCSCLSLLLQSAIHFTLHAAHCGEAWTVNHTHCEPVLPKHYTYCVC